MADSRYPIASPTNSTGAETITSKRTARGRTTDPGDLGGGFQLGVGLRHFRGIHEHGHVALVGNVEEDRRGPDDGGYGVQVPDLQDAGPPEYRYGGHRRGPDQVSHNHGATLEPAVNPGSCRQTDQQEGRKAGGIECTNFELAGAEQSHCEDGKCQLPKLRPELADGLARPEGHEVPVPPKRGRLLSRGSLKSCVTLESRLSLQSVVALLSIVSGPGVHPPSFLQ